MIHHVGFAGGSDEEMNRIIIYKGRPLLLWLKWGVRFHNQKRKFFSPGFMGLYSPISRRTSARASHRALASKGKSPGSFQGFRGCLRIYISRPVDVNPSAPGQFTQYAENTKPETAFAASPARPRHTEEGAATSLCGHTEAISLLCRFVVETGVELYEDSLAEPSKS